MPPNAWPPASFPSLKLCEFIPTSAASVLNPAPVNSSSAVLRIPSCIASAPTASSSPPSLTPPNANNQKAESRKVHPSNRSARPASAPAQQARGHLPRNLPHKSSFPAGGIALQLDGTENTVAAQALRKSLTLIPASRRIARRVPSAMSPEWCGSVIFLPVWDGRIENQT